MTDEAPLGWQELETAPLNRSVLVRHKDAVGEVYDVAIFVGKQPDGSMRWIMGDVRLDGRQLTHWHELPDPPLPGHGMYGDEG